MIKRKIRGDLLKYSLWTGVLKVTFFIHFYPATVNVTDTSCFLLRSNVYPKLIYKRAYIILSGVFFSMHSSFKYKQESISTVLHCFKPALFSKAVTQILNISSMKLLNGKLTSGYLGLLR